jgi:hypothetical protein
MTSDHVLTPIPIVSLSTSTYIQFIYKPAVGRSVAAVAKTGIWREYVTRQFYQAERKLRISVTGKITSLIQTQSLSDPLTSHCHFSTRRRLTYSLVDVHICPIHIMVIMVESFTS